VFQRAGDEIAIAFDYSWTLLDEITPAPPQMGGDVQYAYIEEPKTAQIIPSHPNSLTS
jgi:hypothetical protein